MYDLTEQLQPPLAGPRWGVAESAGAIEAQFDGTALSLALALVVAVKRTGESGALTLLNAEGHIALQAIRPGEGWQQLMAPPPTDGATDLLVMSWSNLPRVEGGTLEAFNAVLRPPPQLDAAELQTAITLLQSREPETVTGSLLRLPAPTQGPGTAVPSAHERPTTMAQPEGQSAADLTTHSMAHRVSPAPVPPDIHYPPRKTQSAFAFASCQYPAGLLDRPIAGASFDRLDHALAHPGSNFPMAALLLLGDQIYADASYGILDPKRVEDRFHQAYVGYLSGLAKRSNIRFLSNNGRLHDTPDDHEFIDNWEPGPDVNLNNRSKLEDGLAAFDTHRPGQLPRSQPGGGYWGPVDVGGEHEVFMLDARTTRDPRPWGPAGLDQTQAHILDADQRTALETWLTARQAAEQTNGGPVEPKFVSSSVWLLPRLVGRNDGKNDGASALSDSWDGYPASLYWLLCFIARENIRGVVMLCGDAHLAGHTTVRLQAVHQPENALHILHAPALYAPFPFANGHPHEYRCIDSLTCETEQGKYTGEVSSSLWPLGDGFVRVSVTLTSGAWQVTAHFDTGPATERTEGWQVD